MLRHDNPIIFVDIEHRFLLQSSQQKNATKKLANFGRILIATDDEEILSTHTPNPHQRQQAQHPALTECNPTPPSLISKRVPSNRGTKPLLFPVLAIILIIPNCFRVSGELSSAQH